MRARNRGEYGGTTASRRSRYKVMQSYIGKEIQFIRGLPESKEDPWEIDPKSNNMLVFDDFVAQTTDSPLVSLLFTQGRHRNASVILLLQNMFLKGKFNTDMSRNAQYMALFRSPCDRKQIGIMAERMFHKNRQRFMSAYFQKRKECLVISSFTIAQARRVIRKY